MTERQISHEAMEAAKARFQYTGDGIYEIALNCPMTPDFQLAMAQLVKEALQQARSSDHIGRIFFVAEYQDGFTFALGSMNLAKQKEAAGIFRSEIKQSNAEIIQIAHGGMQAWGARVADTVASLFGVESKVFESREAANEYIDTFRKIGSES